MTQSFDRLVERQIQKALAEGKLSNLEGEGKPLADRSGEAFTDMATAVAVRIMAEAGPFPRSSRSRNCSKRRGRATGRPRATTQSALRWP